MKGKYEKIDSQVDLLRDCIRNIDDIAKDFEPVFLNLITKDQKCSIIVHLIGKVDDIISLAEEKGIFAEEELMSHVFVGLSDIYESDLDTNKINSLHKLLKLARNNLEELIIEITSLDAKSFT